ncbi:hypothetical protein M0L20_22195 [Spirosoma sp. RP8]|uniref:Immunoglobulin domain-containing protein n=1 Tax=Spirosoma liriopis TaxID=2937440 RepID=A0ABT0HQY9_9BACT|nr:hypothetical protein [Spirosoma liriopis]MCK8494596.1 hypothetical protein [Spirosoma liriopis]
MQWSGPAGQGPLNDNWFINNITQGGTYTYTVTDLSTGCASSTQVNIQVNPANYLGTIDDTKCNLITGWLVDFNCQDRSNKVRILIDGELVETVEANVPRKDVRLHILGRSSGYEQYGYRWTVPERFRQGVHTVVITDMNGNKLNNWENRTFGIAPPKTFVAANNIPFSILSGPVTVCAGSFVALGRDRFPPDNKVRWSGPDGKLGPDNQDWYLYHISPSQASPYTFTVTDINGCTNSAQVTINVTPPDYLGNLEEANCNRAKGWIINRNCGESPVQLFYYFDGQLVDSSYTNVPRDDAKMHVFGNKNNFINYGFEWPIPANFRQGVHTLRITDNMGTTLFGPTEYGLAMHTMRINGQNVANGAQYFVCEGSQLTLDLDRNPANYSIRWSGPNGSQGPVNDKWTINAIGSLQQGLYTYTVTNPDGCSSSAQVNIQLSTKPVFGFSAAGSDQVFKAVNTSNGPASLTVTICDGGNMAMSNLNWPSPAYRLVEHLQTNGNVEGYTADRAPNDVDAYFASLIFSKSYGPFKLINPAVVGTFTQSYMPYVDSNNNGHYDAGVDCAGDPIILTYVFTPPVKPTAPTFNGGSTPSTTQGTSVLFSSSCPSGGQVKWVRYNAQGSIVSYAIQNEVTFDSSEPVGSSHYTVECINTPCPAAPTDFTFTVLPTNLFAPLEPTFNGGNNPSTCEGAPVVFTSGCSSGTVHWTRYNSSGGSQIGEAYMNPLGFAANMPAGQYYYSVECADNGRFGPSKTFTFTVHGKPVVSPPVRVAPNAFTTNSSYSICEGTYVAFGRDRWPANFPDYIMQWTGPNNSRGEANQDWEIQAIQAAQEGIYTYTVTDPNGCSNSTQVNIEVNAKPVFGFAASGSSPVSYSANTTGPVTNNVTICSGGMLTFSGFTQSQPNIGLLEKSFSSGNVTLGGDIQPTERAQNNISSGQVASGFNQSYGPYAVTNGSMGTIEQWYTPYIDQNGNGQYDSGECLGDKITLLYKIVPLTKPTSVSASPGSISSARSVTLSASGCANTTKWEWPSGTATGSTLVTTVNQTTTFGVRCVNGTGCQSDTIAITVRQLNMPAPIISASKLSVCGGDTVTLRATGCNNDATVLWSNGMTGSSIVFAPTATANYYAVCKIDEAQGGRSQEIRINVRAMPTVTGTRSYSSGQTLSLTAFADGASSYSWKGPRGFTYTGAKLEIQGVSPLSTAGSYTVTANYTGGGCSPSTVVVVSVNGPALQTGEISQTSACAGSVLSVPFSTTSASSDFASGNIFTIQLSDMGGNFNNPVTIGNGSASPITVTIPANTLPGTAYRMRVMSSDPLSEGTVSPTILTVTAPPSLSASSNSPGGQVRIDSTLRLTTSGQNLTGATYRWTGPNGFTSTVANPTIPHSTTAHNGTYTVTATTPSGCTATAQTSVSLTMAACMLSFASEPVISCDSAAADTTRQGKIVVQLQNVPAGSALRVTLYQQTTVVATLTTSPALFTGLTDGTYRIDAYALIGTDTCRAGSRTATVYCNKTSLNIRIKSVDATPKETDLIPRVNGGLGTLTLSVEELDGVDLSGYSYLWTGPAGTPAATTTTLTAGRIGEYKVTLVKGADTLIAYTTLRAKPCKQVAHTYQCGRPASPVGNLDDTGISNLAPGDTIRTGDFDVIVTEILGGGSSGWTGKGYTQIPYLGDTKIAVNFTNAVVNDCYEFTGAGTVQSAYDPNWKSVTSLDTVLHTLINLKDFLAIYTNKDKAKLQEYVNSMETVKQAYSNDDDIPSDTKTIIISNTSLVQQKLNDLMNCDSTGAPGARMASTSCPNAQEILEMINTGLPDPLPIKERKVLEYGQFQWFTQDNDISDQINSPSQRSFVESKILKTGTLNDWNKYLNYDLAKTKDIYENGKIIDRLLYLGLRDVLSSDTEERILSNFYSGRQAEVAFEEGTPVSNRLIEYYKSNLFHPYVSEFIKRITPKIKNGQFSSLDSNFVFGSGGGGIGLPDFSNENEIPSYDFYAMMGGTQKIRVEMELKTIRAKGVNLYNSQPYEISTRKLDATFHIIDWFGSDMDDISGSSVLKSLSESLKAFFMLQHYWGVGHPFQTRISAKLINNFTIQ